jgi:hypothetical protein
MRRISPDHALFAAIQRMGIDHRAVHVLPEQPFFMVRRNSFLSA